MSASLFAPRRSLASGDDSQAPIDDGAPKAGRDRASPRTGATARSDARSTSTTDATEPQPAKGAARSAASKSASKGAAAKVADGSPGASEPRRTSARSGASAKPGAAPANEGSKIEGPPGAVDPKGDRDAKTVHGYAREAAALLLLASALYTSLALASFRGDPMRSEIVGADWVGPVGALIAGALVQATGLCAWLVPIDLALFAGPLLQGRKPKVTLVRIAGDLVVFVVAAALLHVAFPKSTAFGEMPLGGSVGELFGEVMRALFSTLGSYIVGLTVVSLILIGRAAFSIIDWAQRAERRARALRQRGEGGLRALVGAWDQARELDEKRREEERRAGEPVITEACDEAIVAALADDSPVPFPKVKPLVPAMAGGDAGLMAFAGIGGAGLLGPGPALAGGAGLLGPGPALAGGAGLLQGAPALAGNQGTPGMIGNAARAARAEAPTPTPAAALAERARKTRKKPGADVSAAPPADAAERVAAASGPEIIAALDERDGLEIRLAEGSPASPGSAVSSVDLVQESTADTASAAGEIAAPNAIAAPRPVLVAGAIPAKIAAPAASPHAEPPAAKRELPPTPPPPAEPVIIDTSAASEAQKPAEIVRIVPSWDEGFRLPSTTLLEAASEGRVAIDGDHLKQTAIQLEKVLADYGVSGKVEEIHPGPTVTTFEVSPAAGTKVSKVASLADDLALGLSRKVRIVAPIPGKNRIGFEVPNDRRVPVVMRELVEDKRFLEMKAPLPCILGRDIIGAPFFADLASMPHVIVAGATGAGKSVGLNVMLISLLYRRTPAELRMLMIDPKVVELAPFDGIPHMLLPVVTDMKQASNALKWAVDEMERRYQLFANAGTRNITSYNGWAERVQKGEIRAPKKTQPAKVAAVAFDGTEVEVEAAGDGSDAELPEKLPFIVIVVDEFADLMMQQGKEVEASVARLAQKARAAGMHVILATQRPSVDVITGMIKANFPTRIAFRVAQKVDSRTILDEQGAEHLLGRGDMLIKMNGSNDTRRVQCPFCTEEEVQRVTDFLRLQGTPVYDENILKPRDEEGEVEAGDDEMDAMYDAAVRVVADTRRCSTSWLQRKLGIGYNRAAKMVEAMEKRGVVGPANGAKDREVLIGAM